MTRASLSIPFRDQLQQQLGTAYAIERELGGGGMSRVFVARETALERLVVLKVLPPDLAAVLSTDRFRREIQFAAKLQHPHIVPLLTAGSAECLYYTMPLIEGESLRTRVARQGELPVADAVRILREVADALAYAHAQGVVHRDIKPDNILLSAGHAVVTDFGVAKALSASAPDEGSGLTSVGLAIGTPAYMAPEQAAADPATDHRADLYAFGVMAYELLTGQPPFAGRPPASLLAAHAAEPPEPITRRRPALPEPLAALVMRCLAKRPADRPQSATELLAVLDAVATTAAAGTVPAARAAGHGRSRWIAAGAGILAMAGAAIGWRMLRAAPAVSGPAATIAVVPLGAASGDTALLRIGRDLTVLLSANLDGQGQIRMADAQTVLAQAGGQTPSLAEAQALARKLGAQSVLHGALIGLGGQVVRVEASLVTADSGRVLAKLTAEAPRDSLSALTDSLAWSLLRQLWRGRDAPTPTIAGLTTHSWASLRAFLQGEAFFGSFRLQQAEDAYLRAVEADSTFWLAWRRLNYLRGAYMDRPTDTAISRRVREHRAALPDRERALIEIGLVLSNSDSARALDRRERYQRLLRQYPDFWWGWWVLADNDFHSGSIYHGVSTDEVIAELQQVLSLNPGFAPAWDHLLGLVVTRDSVLLAQAIAGLERSSPDLMPGGPLGPDRVWKQWASPAAEILLDPQEMGPPGSAPLPSAAWLAAFTNASPQNLQLVLSRVAVAGLPPRTQVTAQLANVHAHAARGAWDSALVAAGALPPEIRATEGYRLAAIGAWAGGMPVTEVARYRAAVAPALPRLPSALRAEMAWLDGLVGLTQKDSAQVEAARRGLRATGDSAAGLLDRALGAMRTITLQGQLRPAADTLACLEWDRTWLPAGQDGWRMPATFPVQRLVGARALAASGDTAAAIRLLNWVDGAPTGNLAYAVALLRPYALLERARLHEGKGDRRRAKYDYEALLRRLDRPTASLQPVRADAERGYARVSGASEVQPR